MRGKKTYQKKNSLARDKWSPSLSLTPNTDNNFFTT